jgi:hypothetical protein
VPETSAAKSCIVNTALWERLRDRAARDTPSRVGDLCSRCLQDLDHALMTEVDALRHSAQLTEGSSPGYAAR